MKDTDQDSIARIIICDGMSNEHINPSNQFSDKAEHIGRSEIYRLLGLGKGFGKGPLAVFLRTAIEDRNFGSSTHLISLKSKAAEFNDTFSEAHDYPSELEDIFAASEIIETDKGIIPWKAICQSISNFIGKPFTEETTVNACVRFLVVGCPTEGRPLAIASQLRNIMRCKEVAVSSYLIASSEREAHYAALRHMYAAHGIDVLLDLEETYKYVNLQTPTACNSYTPCVIDPPNVVKQLGGDGRRIVELLCLHWTKCSLHPLAGGFSGSFLFVASGWKNDAQTEPMVLKIDNFIQMRKEISGYFEVKDLLGKHIPHFGYPVYVGGYTGVGMELATMDGSPETLQDIFQHADIEEIATLFHDRFAKTLSIIGKRLYANTKKIERITPYQQFGLNSSLQMQFLKENIEIISSYLSELRSVVISADFSNIAKIFQMITANNDGIECETCLAHGDLNFQNIICDHVGNIWFIDWTHCGRHPLELDFAKLENDVKFVMSSEFGMDDLPQLRKFENYLLANKLPGDEKNLPDNLRFVKWDLRYRKILTAVKLIRQSCFALKSSDDWLVYKIALLRYSTHTLSFDKRRNRGECELQQLVYALFSTEQLLMALAVDDFHLKIRGARHSTYPPRQRISIDSLSWRVKCPEYSPPYHVDSLVIENDRTARQGGWADPENLKDIDFKNCSTDKRGRPLHPRGRTGIEGRGLLGRWGMNPAVCGVFFRSSGIDSLQVLLCNKTPNDIPILPKGFILPEQQKDDAMSSVLKNKCGWHLPVTGEIVSEEISYDDRQTDNAWVETTVFYHFFNRSDSPQKFSSKRAYEEVSWWAVNTELWENLEQFEKRNIKAAAEAVINEKSKYKDLLLILGD